MSTALQDRLQYLLKARAKAIAKIKFFEDQHAAYVSATKELAEHEEKILEEMVASKLSVAGFPDGSLIQIVQTPGSTPKGTCGIDELRKQLLKNGVSLTDVDKAIDEVKTEKKAQPVKPVNTVAIDYKGTITLTEEDIKIKKLTKVEILFYHEHDIKDCENLQVRFRYRAEDTSPIPNVIRRDGKDGENADLVEGFATGVWRTEDNNLCMRVRNRNYKTAEDLNLPPGNVYHGDKGEFPPLTYRIDRVVPGTLEVCRGNKWVRVTPRD